MDRCRSRGRAMAVLAAAAVLSGCPAGVGGLEATQPGGLPDVVADRLMPADTPKMRVLRAEVFLAVIAYAGLKRIEGSSNTARINSRIFLMRVEAAQKKIGEAAEVAKTETTAEKKQKVDALRALEKEVREGKADASLLRNHLYGANVWLSRAFEFRMNEVLEELAELTQMAIEVNESSASLLGKLATGSTTEKLKVILELVKDAARIVRRGRVVLMDVATLQKQLAEDLIFSKQELKAEYACRKRGEGNRCEEYDWRTADPKKRHWDYARDMLGFSCKILAELSGEKDDAKRCDWKGPELPI